MTPPTERRPDTDATCPPSAHSGVDETAAGASAVPTAGPGFGPPAAAGEVGTLGPYRVVKELGKGGMGAVYAAIDTRLDRRLALKVMLPQFAADPAARERFLREARAAARVKHDNVVTVYEADERDGVPYIAMEYLEGYPLDEYLKKKGNPTAAQVLRLAAETAAGLAAAHRQGLVHRDVKPGNLWLEAPAGRVKVLDFGLARPVDAEVELTKSGAVVGTPAYMSPEQARGEKVDHRTDLFSLGAVLYRLVTGRLPFQAPNTMAMLIALGTEDPPPVRERNPSVPEPLAELIHQLLSKSPDARPASADEVVKRVRAMSQARPAPAAAPVASQVVYVPIQVTAAPEANPFAGLDATEAEPAPAAAPVKPRRQWAVATGLAALVLAVFGGVIIIIRNRDGSETKIEVPDGATVTVKGKDGKTLATVGPKTAPVADHSPDRKAAEWVLSIGGVVRADGQDLDLRAPADLPKERFTLTLITLRGIGVTDVGLAHLKDCKGLQILHLQGTKVTDAGLAHLKDCKGLTLLDLRQTKVTDEGLAHLKDCKQLRALWLNGTGVTDAGLVNLKDCKGLTGLALQGTKVTDAGLAVFKDCDGLQALDLGHTTVTDAGLAHFKDCKELRELWLTGTGVTDAGLANFKDCKGLTLLDLNGTKVTDAGLAHFKDCNGLRALDLRQTRVTAPGSADFHDAVPGCKIEHDGGVIEAVDVDRKAAEYVVSIGGSVKIAGQDRDFKDAADLPKERFTLATINLYGLKVTDAELARFKDCRGLRQLGLGDIAQVTDAGLAHFKDCKGLTYLGLSGTGVTDAGLAHFKDCEGITNLDLRGTKVTDAGLAHFKDRKGLTTLHLFGAPVTDAGVAHFKDCKALSLLSLSGPGVTDAGLAHFKDCKGLTYLDLNFTGVTDAGLAHFKDCEGITNLDLRGTKVTDAGLAHFKDRKGLTTLHLFGAPVTDAGVAHFKDCKALSLLSLSGPGVTDAGLAYLKGSAGLRNLFLKGANVTAAGLADFHAAVPGCKIEHDGGAIEPVAGDRPVAAWVLALGGTVRVNGGEREHKAAATLPADGFAVTSVNLDGTKVTDGGLACLRTCKGLALLGLSKTTVTDAGLANLKESAALTGLWLGKTAVTDAGLTHLKGLPGLTTLGLGDTAVTDVGLAELAAVRSLTELDVRGTRVTAAGRAAFHAAVPGCRVLHDGGVIQPKN